MDGRVEAWSALAAERDVELVTDVEAGLVVRSAPGRLEQVLDNLLSNALEVAPPGSAVRVTGRRRTEAASSSRCSTPGPGMRPEQRARAFDRFWRPTGADATAAPGSGSRSCKRLVTADGGTIELDQSPEGGLAARAVLRPT